MALRRVGAAGKGKQKELTEEQKQEIKEAFDLFDTDGSVLFRGSLLGLVLHSLPSFVTRIHTLCMHYKPLTGLHRCQGAEGRDASARLRAQEGGDSEDDRRCR